MVALSARSTSSNLPESEAPAARRIPHADHQGDRRYYRGIGKDGAAVRPSMSGRPRGDIRRLPAHQRLNSHNSAVSTMLIMIEVARGK